MQSFTCQQDKKYLLEQAGLLFCWMTQLHIAGKYKLPFRPKSVYGSY